LGLRGCPGGSDFELDGEPYTLNELGQLIVAIEAGASFSAQLSTSLNAIASAVLFNRQPFERIVWCRAAPAV
jgi:hypothetical protein